jgi:hypothetical protein
MQDQPVEYPCTMGRSPPTAQYSTKAFPSQPERAGDTAQHRGLQDPLQRLPGAPDNTR